MTRKAKSSGEIFIRWMIRRDMDRVIEIEQERFEFPWFEEDFIRCLRQRNCIGMVATTGDESNILGFMIYELHKTRLHLLSLAVSNVASHKGVARQMMQKLIEKLSPHRRTLITLEVRETNLLAQLFFKACGFKATNVLHNYYEDSPEDAYLMQYRLENCESAVPVNRIEKHLHA